MSTAGSEGVIRSGDLKVTATSPASNVVNVSNGSALVLNRSGGGDGQSYTVHNSGQSQVTLNPTGGGGRSDLVIVKIRDPEFAPWDPPPEGQEDTYQYVMLDVIYDVPSGTKSFGDLGLTYSAYALARIDRPGGTGIVTSGQVVDLRDMAAEKFIVRGDNVTCSGTDLLNAMPPFTWEHFPDTAHFPVDIPSWATNCLVQGFINPLLTNGPGIGALRVVIDPGGYASDLTNFNVNAAGNRQTFVVGGTIPLPSAIRGTTQGFFLEGRLANEQSAGCLQNVDGITTFQLQITFFEGVE